MARLVEVSDEEWAAISGQKPVRLVEVGPAQGAGASGGWDAPKPSNLGVFSNATAKGVASVPDAVLNAGHNAVNLAKAGFGLLTGNPNLEMVEPPNLTNRLFNKLGFIRDDLEPQTAGQRIVDAIGQGVGGGVAGPAGSLRQVAASAAIGGATGMFGGAVAEGTGSPLAGMVASLGAVPMAAAVGKTAVRSARQVAGGQDARTGRVLATAADVPPAELAAQIARGNVEYVPGSVPTTWQAAPNAGLSQLKRSSQSAGADFSGIEAAQNAARVAALDGLQPGAAGLTAHEAKQIAGGVLRENYDFQRGALKDAERGAWQNPALEGIRFNLPAEKLRGAVEQFYPGVAYGESPALLRRVAEAADGGQPLTHPEVQKLRSLVGEMARDKINTDAPGRAAALAVKGVLSDMYKGAEEAGAHKLAATGEGPFGPVYGNLAGDPENAIAHLLKTRTGSVPNAETHPLAGGMELVAGIPTKEGSGLLHIAAHGRDDALRVLPELMRNGDPYSRLQVTKAGNLQRKGRADQIFLGDGTYEAPVRLTWDNAERQWIPTAYLQDEGKRIAAEVGKLAHRSDASTGRVSVPPVSAAGSSIDDILGQMLAESAAARVPAPPPPGPLRNPRAYSPNLISPEQAGLLSDARFLTTTRKQRFETGPTKGLLDMGTDGLPKKQGAEAFDLFYSPRASQTDDIAALGTAFPGNPEVWNAMRTGAVSDLLGRSINQNTGLLSNAKLHDYTKARSGALKGLLSDEQMGTLEAVKADAMRAETAENLGRVRGSDTAQKLLGAGMLENPWVSRAATLVPRLGPAAVDWLKTIIRTQQARKVGEALIDPETARRVLAAYEKQQRPTAFDGAGGRVALRQALEMAGRPLAEEDRRRH